MKVATHSRASTAKGQTNSKFASYRNIVPGEGGNRTFACLLKRASMQMPDEVGGRTLRRTLSLHVRSGIFEMVRNNGKSESRFKR
jgi:hypothetical protein